MKQKKTKAKVMIVMGSDSDFSTMKEAAQALDQFAIAYQVSIISAHRTPQEMAKFANRAKTSGIQVIIAGAGGAAHLPGMIAAHTILPVIGVPVPMGELQGLDALLSIVQMPKGVPVATVAIGNAYNAGLLAAQILGAKGMERYKENLRKSVLKKILKTNKFFPIKNLK